MTESKPDNARVETAIKLDKKDFAGIPPSMMQNGSEMKISPMAGTCQIARRIPSAEKPANVKFRGPQGCCRHGRGSTAHLSRYASDDTRRP